MRGEWKVKKLASICILFTDGDWVESKDQSASGIRLVQTGNVGEGEFKDRREKARWISPDTFERLKCQEVVPGDCLVSRLPDPVGRSCIIPNTGDKMITAVDCTILRFRDSEICADFFNYFTQSKAYLCEVERHCSGATRKRISRKNLGLVSVPLPPLAEQERIVAILDDAFAGIATATAHAQKNLANAREVFESHLNAVFTQKGDGWVEKKLGEEIDLLTGFAFKSKGYTDSPDGMRLLRGDNIVQNAFRWQDVRRWPKNDLGAYSKYELRIGDVVVAMDRTWVKAGVKFAQVSARDLPCLLVQRVSRLRPKENLSGDFLKFLIGSVIFTRYVLSIQTGLGVPHISGPQIQSFQFLMPPLAVQKILASQLRDIEESVAALESIYRSKLAALAELKQSILQKAFAGELTAAPDRALQEAGL